MCLIGSVDHILDFFLCETGECIIEEDEIFSTRSSEDIDFFEKRIRDEILVFAYLGDRLRREDRYDTPDISPGIGGIDVGDTVIFYDLETVWTIFSKWKTRRYHRSWCEKLTTDFLFRETILSHTPIRKGDIKVCPDTRTRRYCKTKICISSFFLKSEMISSNIIVSTIEDNFFF